MPNDHQPDLIPLEDLQPHPSLLGTELELWRAMQAVLLRIKGPDHPREFLAGCRALRALADRKGVRG